MFDSDICDWKRKTSTFDQYVFGKEKLMFVIEDEEENVFGGYVNEKIDNYYCTNENEWPKECICDVYSYVFEIKKEENEMKTFKYPIQFEERENAFKLYGKDSRTLFLFGYENRLLIMKNNFKEKSSFYNKIITPKRIHLFSIVDVLRFLPFDTLEFVLV